MSSRIWVPVGRRRVAVAIERPTTSTATGVLVVVPPVGFEGEVAHHLVRTLALRAAAVGLVVGVLDLHGTGDSSSLRPGDDIVSEWRADVRETVGHMRRLAPGLPVTVVGMRLSASILASSADDAADLKVCWEPVSGRQFLRTQHMLYRFSQPEAPVDPRRPELLGLDLDDEQRAAVSAVAAPRPGAAAAVRVVVEEDRAAAGEYFTIDPYFGRVPTRSLDGLIDLCMRRTMSDDTASALPADTGTWEAATRSALMLADGGVTETFEDLPPGGLAAVVVTPPDGVKVKDTWVVFTAQGTERSSGPAAFFARLSRELATEGYTCVRAERRGIGLHLGASSDRQPNPFSPGAADDVVSTVDWARSAGARRVAVVGSCVGAWLALSASRRSRIDAVLALSVPAWSAREADFDASFLDHWHGAPTGSGEAGPEGAQPTLRARVVEAVRSHPRLLALGMGPRQMARAASFHSLGIPVLRRVPARTAVRLVLAGRDLDFFRSSAGPLVVTLLTRMGRPVFLVEAEGIDHALRTTASQELVRTQARVLLRDE